MNIVIIGTAFPLRGGIAHYNALLAKYLSRNHSVRTITFKRQYPGMFFPGKTQDEQGDLPGVEPAPAMIDSIDPLNWIRVGRHVRSLKPDLLLFKYWLPFFGPCFGTIAKVAKRGRATQALFICDNVIPHERRPGDVLFTRYAFRQADSFIVQSAAVETDLLRFFPDARYRLVPHPVYENFGSSLPKSDARLKLGLTAGKIMLFFGYIRAYKGLTILIEAMKEIPDAMLLAVGEFYDDEAKYRSLIGSLGLESRVRIVSSYVPNDEVAAYFSAADVVVLPYLSATQSGIVQIAYNFDRPVIATGVGGLAEVVIHGKTGSIVPPGDPRALAAAIRDYYDNAREEEYTRHVREEKKRYSWDHMVSTIEELAGGIGSKG